MKILDHLNIPYDDQSDDCIITCPSCYKEEKCSVSKEEGNIWQCYTCKQKGNALTLIRLFYQNLPALTPKQARLFTERKQGVHTKVLRDEGIKYDGTYFWFPVSNQEGKVIALHKYCPRTNIAYASPKPWSCSILGLNQLTDASVIWVAEGHADYLIGRQILKDAETTVDLLGTCGSGFSGAYLSVLEGKDVVLLFDNDEAGQKGVQSVARRLKSSGHSVNSIRYLDWSKVTVPSHSTIPNKFDLRDLYNAYQGN